MMAKPDLREFCGGALLTAGGVGFAAYAAMHYTIGTATRMGPGMVPVILGVLLALFGLMIAAGAFLRAARMDEIRIVVPLIISASILAFAVLIRPMGMIPAVFACVVIATLAEGKFRPVVSFTLAAVLSVTAWLIFVVLLQLPIAMINWPF